MIPIPIPDTSVLLAGADHKHRFFERIEPTLVSARDDGHVLAQSLNECFMALTCSAIATPGAALAYLEQFCVHPPKGIAPEDHPAALRELATLGVSGGALHDGLLAIAARDAGKSLLSMDRRAARAYERCGVEYSMMM